MLKYFRHSAHLNQDELADLLGVSKSAISMYEKGTRRLTDQASKKLTLLKDAWAGYLKEGLPPGMALQTHSPNYELYRTVLKSCAQKASAEAVRLSQMIEKINSDRELLRQKRQFLRYLSLMENKDAFPKVVLNKIERQLKKRGKSCCPVQQKILVFRLNSNTLLQQLALEAAKSNP